MRNTVQLNFHLSEWQIQGVSNNASENAPFHLITSPACYNYGLIPDTSASHLLHLNLFSLELIISRLLIAPQHLTNGIKCHRKTKMLIPLPSSKDF